MTLTSQQNTLCSFCFVEPIHRDQQAPCYWRSGKIGKQWKIKYKCINLCSIYRIGNELHHVKTQQLNAPLAGCACTDKTTSCKLNFVYFVQNLVSVYHICQCTLCALYIIWFKCILYVHVNVYELAMLKLKVVKKLVGRRKI